MPRIKFCVSGKEGGDKYYQNISKIVALATLPRDEEIIHFDVKGLKGQIGGRVSGIYHSIVGRHHKIHIYVCGAYLTQEVVDAALKDGWQRD